MSKRGRLWCRPHVPSYWLVMEKHMKRWKPYFMPLIARRSGKSTAFGQIRVPVPKRPPVDHSIDSLKYAIEPFTAFDVEKYEPNSVIEELIRKHADEWSKKFDDDILKQSMIYGKWAGEIKVERDPYKDFRMVVRSWYP